MGQGPPDGSDKGVGKCRGGSCRARACASKPRLASDHAGAAVTVRCPRPPSPPGLPPLPPASPSLSLTRWVREVRKVSPDLHHQGAGQAGSAYMAARKHKRKGLTYQWRKHCVKGP